MANLTVREASTGSETPLEDVNLNITNQELIEGLIDGRVLRPLTGGQKHLVVARDNSISEDVQTLAQLGFQDGDVVKIVTKDVGATPRP
ncbi:MAG: hypothetical protein AAFZ63_13385 [Bacteroidota bacterium]